MKGSWTTNERINYVPLRDFTLKVGDRVIFTNFVRRGDEIDTRRRLSIGEVVGVYPHIFHVKYYTGPNDDIVQYRSFKKIDYQLGEVARYDSNGQA